MPRIDRWTRAAPSSWTHSLDGPSSHQDFEHRPTPAPKRDSHGLRLNPAWRRGFAWLAPLGQRRIQILLAILFFNGAISDPFSTFLPIYVSEKLGEGQALTANLRSTVLVFMAVFALVGGFASDAIGPRATFFIGVSGTPASAAIFLVDDLWLLFLLSAYAGVGLGMLSTGSQSYLLNATLSVRIGAATGLYFAGRTLGAAVGDPIAGAILNDHPFELLAVLGIVASIPVLASIVLFVPAITETESSAENIAQMLAGYVRIMMRFPVLALAAMQFLRTTFWGAAGLALPLLIKSVTGSNLAVGAFGAATLTGGVAAVLVIGPVSDRIGRRNVVLAAIATMIVGSVVLIFSLGTATGLFAAGIVASVGAWTLSGQVPPLVKQIERGGESGRVMALTAFPWALGTLTGSQLHGRLTETHPALLFAITTALLAGALVTAILLFARADIGRVSHPVREDKRRRQ